MNEYEKKIQDLIQEAARWRQRAINAAEKACFNCEEYRQNAQQPCDISMCPAYIVKQEAGE